MILLLVFLAVGLVLVIRSFDYMPVAELKRQARQANHQAAKIYALRGQYGIQIWIWLWGSLGLCMAGVVLLLSHITWTWLVLVIDIPILILVYSVVPWLRRPKPGLGLAAAVSPVLEPLLRFSSPIMSRLINWIGHWIEPEPRPMVHSKDEILEMLAHASDNSHVNRDEIKIAASALVFGDKKIGMVMIPISVVRCVKNDDVLSPVLLAELHDSGFSRFPVRDKAGYCGTLLLKDLTGMRASKMVADVIRPEVYYVNEQASLDQALKAFLKTKHHLFLVVNEFEEVVGILTIEDVIEQIIGMRIVDEFDQYDDLRTMALKIAEQKRSDRVQEHKAIDNTHETTPD